MRSYDIDPLKCTHTLKEVVNGTDVVFISVPTPSNPDGSMHLDILESVLSDISDVYEDGSIILIRSTVAPGTTRKLQNKFNLPIVFNPEFLTERSAKFDFINQARFILGGAPDHTAVVANLYKWRFGSSVPCIETNWETAEMIKYMNNCFFATKVSFMNEMKLVADKVGVDWDMAVEGFVRDGRIGHTHLNVPGGSCFPKDIQAMIQFGEDLGMDLNTLQGAWETNCEVRPERDWEQLKGRSIIKS